MDGSRFDALTRAIGTSTSRRAAIKSLLGLGGALVAGNRLGLDGAEAARRGYSGPKFPTPGPSDPSCPSGQTWNGEACVCSAGITCGSNCCGDGQECSGGHASIRRCLAHRDRYGTAQPALAPLAPTAAPRVAPSVRHAPTVHASHCRQPVQTGKPGTGFSVPAPRAKPAAQRVVMTNIHA